MGIHPVTPLPHPIGAGNSSPAPSPKNTLRRPRSKKRMKSWKAKKPKIPSASRMYVVAYRSDTTTISEKPQLQCSFSRPALKDGATKSRDGVSALAIKIKHQKHSPRVNCQEIGTLGFSTLHQGWAAFLESRPKVIRKIFSGFPS